MEDVEAGAWSVSWPSMEDLSRARTLQAQYGGLSLGLVDSTVIALSERLREPKVATLDIRHFSVVRPSHVVGLELLPP
ncbi:MAG TPA: twitching motility protein PilT [Chloroflexota bacterium]|nr:twitching motility protein PilT [Chloroflexota bacterium]